MSPRALSGAVLFWLAAGAVACGSDAGPGAEGGGGGIAGVGSTGGGATAGMGGISGTGAVGAGGAGASSGMGASSGTGGAGGGAPTVDLVLGRIAVGDGAACALDAAGKVVCFGSISDGPTNAGNVQISVSANSACVIDSAQAAHCWGKSKASPSGTFSAVAVAADQGACGLTSSGSVSCWGDTGSVVLGWVVPTSKFKSIAATSGYACGVLLDGKIECWGSSMPALPPAGSFERVFASVTRVCGLSTAGAPVCTDNKPVPPPPENIRFAQFAVRGGVPTYACGIDAAGGLSCWEGSSAVKAAPSGVFVDVVAGDQPCAIMKDGSAKCWGDGFLTPPASFRAF